MGMTVGYLEMKPIFFSGTSEQYEGVYQLHSVRLRGQTQEPRLNTTWMKLTDVVQ